MNTGLLVGITAALNDFAHIERRPELRKKQVSCPDQIHKGLRIIVHGNDCDGDQKTILTVAGPWYKENGKMKVDVTFHKDGARWMRTLILEKYSVVSRDIDKSWEQNNWLEIA